jgi:DNA recombination protein RmuC
MLAVQVMMTILKDARMREQADVIQREVALLLDDTGQLRARVLDFQRHFGQLTPGLEKIIASTDKISRRASRIESIGTEVSEDEPALVAGATS